MPCSSGGEARQGQRRQDSGTALEAELTPGRTAIHIGEILPAPVEGVTGFDCAGAIAGLTGAPSGSAAIWMRLGPGDEAALVVSGQRSPASIPLSRQTRAVTMPPGAENSFAFQYAPSFEARLMNSVQIARADLAPSSLSSL